MDWTPAFAGVTGLIRASLGKKPTGFLLYIIQAKDEAASPVNVATVLRVPLKIHIPSLPRRREPSQINKLDSRLRGNDKLLEVPEWLSQSMGSRSCGRKRLHLKYCFLRLSKNIIRYVR